MIIETNSKEYERIRSVWYSISRWRPVTDVQKQTFFNWLEVHGAQLNKSRRTPREFAVYENRQVIILGVDYLEFTDTRRYDMFVLQWL